MLSFMLFAGALHVDWREMARGRWPVLALSTVGVALSTLLVGSGLLLLSRGIGLDVPAIWCFVFGALVSPTDPVTVISVLRRTDVPPALEAMVAGEILFNDGVGVVIFTIPLASAVSGAPFSPAEGARLFAIEAGGGVLLGLAVGWLAFHAIGGAAFLVMAALLGIAYAAGWVIRFNIAHVEDHLAAVPCGDPIAWTARITQGVLALAYAVSVAYYLKLLAEFSLKPMALDPAWQPLVANVVVTVLIAGMTLLALGGDLRRVEHLAHGIVSIKIGIIAGLLVALAIAWATDDTAEPLPPARLCWASVSMLLGLIITVQGFETSRYLGHDYPADLRIRTTRHAQWIASAIYLAFIALLTPFLSRAAATDGVAGILDIMERIAPALGLFVLAGAVGLVCLVAVFVGAPAEG